MCLVSKTYSRVNAQESGCSEQGHLMPRDVAESNWLETISKLISDGREGINLKEKEERPQVEGAKQKHSSSYITNYLMCVETQGKKRSFW